MGIITEVPCCRRRGLSRIKWQVQFVGTEPLSSHSGKPEPRPKRQPVGKAPALLPLPRVSHHQPVTKTAPVPLALSRLGAISGLAAHEVGL